MPSPPPPDAPAASSLASLRAAVDLQRGPPSGAAPRLAALVVAALVVAAPVVAAPAGAVAADGPVTLDRIVGRAVAQNERTRVVSAQAEAAEHRVARARAFFFPELTVTGTYTRRLHETTRTIGGRQTIIQRHDALSAQANLLVPLFDARAFPLYRQAKLEGQSAALAAAQERRLVGYEAADAFLMVLGAEQVVEAAIRRLDFARTSLREMRARAEAGLVSSNDVTRGELEVATAERELAAARASARTSRLELGYLVDLDVDAAGGALVAPEALFAEAGRVAPRAETLVAAGLERRLDVAAGRSRTLALAAAAQEPGRRAIPSLAGVAQYRVTNEGGLAGRNGDGFAGLAATWQLWDGGERAADKAERRALLRAGEAQQEALVRRVSLDVRRALVALESAQATHAVSARAAEIAGRLARETTELYRQGLVRALEVADATFRLFQAEVALVRDRYALTIAYLDMRAAAGEDPPGGGAPAAKGQPR